MQRFGLDGGHHGNSVPRPIACMRALDGERDVVGSEFATLGLGVDGPCGVEFVLVDDYRCRLGENIGFISTKESSVK